MNGIMCFENVRTSGNQPRFVGVIEQNKIQPEVNKTYELKDWVELIIYSEIKVKTSTIWIHCTSVFNGWIVPNRLFSTTV